MARRPPIPISVQAAVLFRDKWMCHLCRRPIILHLAMKWLQASIIEQHPGTQLAYWHPNWRRDAAPLLDELGASVDHVHPFSLGGGSEPDNLAAVCAKCNARKSARSDDEFLEKATPWKVHGAHGEPESWDGLCTVFVMLAHRDQGRLTASEKQWLAAIEPHLVLAGKE